ncbi:MAG: cysteine synthase A [Muribaculaceae bacterium]|nr:cysteine synthase A [Muribaculaceae bacterium]
MARIYKDVTELIGNTPIVELTNIEKEDNLKARVLVKLEKNNPGGSVKDRVALAMINAAEADGSLKPGGTIIEPTSGNTGIGLAMVATVRGYKCIIVMPDTMSMERRNLLRALGAELVLTPGNKGMKGAIEKAEELRAELSGSVILGQFDNPANRTAHAQTTANEIWHDTDGKVDIFIAGVGTGGSLTGTAETLKDYKPMIEVIAVEPETSAVLSGGVAGAHKIQGIGAGFIPGNYKGQFVDKIEAVSDDEAIKAARRLAGAEGIIAGISSGAAVAVALGEARKPENAGKMIVAILPDTGERYLSTLLYAFDEYPL